jgi:hypothetical protein
LFEGVQSLRPVSINIYLGLLILLGSLREVTVYEELAPAQIHVGKALALTNRLQKW